MFPNPFDQDMDFSFVSEIPSESQEQNYSEIFLGDRKVYQCLLPDCGKTFKFKSEMARHQATHSDSRPFTCFYENCHKGFKRPDALKNHLRTHANITRYVCTEKDCGMQFVNRAALKYHFLKHKDNKVYKCTHPGCTKAFVSLTQLKQHEKAVKYHKWVERGYGFDENELAKAEEDSIDGSGSTGFTDNESQEDLNRYEFIEKNLKTYKLEEPQEEIPDVFGYLESIYGNKKKMMHIEENFPTQTGEINPVKGCNVGLHISNVVSVPRARDEESKEWNFKFECFNWDFNPNLDSYINNDFIGADNNIDAYLNL